MLSVPKASHSRFDVMSHELPAFVYFDCTSEPCEFCSPDFPCPCLQATNSCVLIDILGIPSDAIKVQTAPWTARDQQPAWKQAFHLSATVPEITFIRFTLKYVQCFSGFVFVAAHCSSCLLVSPSAAAGAIRFWPRFGTLASSAHCQSRHALP